MSTPHDQPPQDHSPHDQPKRDAQWTPDAARDEAHAEPSSSHDAARPTPPALKRTVVRPPTPAGPDSVDGAFVATRLTTLTHELANLLDGSLRVIGLAKRNLDASSAKHTNVCPELLAKQLGTVTAAMMQMAELVRESSLTLGDSGLSGMRSGFGAASSVSEAIRHGVDVMTPIAEEVAIRIDTDIAPELENVVAGPIYAVITNGVRNAIEAIGRQGERYVGGQVYVRAWMQPGKTGHCVMIEILDDGQGMPRSVADIASSNDAMEQSVFSLGFSTKPGGSGIGLSLCRDIVHQLGGTVELRNRKRDPNSGRGGAVMSVCYPVPRLIADRAIAG